MDKKFKIVFREDVELNEKEVINNFWDFREEFENFYFLTKQLTNKQFPTHRDVTNYVKNKSYIECDNLKCKKCQENITFFSRKQYVDFWKKESEYCLKCFDIIIEERADRIINDLKQIIYNFEKISITEFDRLSFIYKLIIFYIIINIEEFKKNQFFNIVDVFECDKYIYELVYAEMIAFLEKQKVIFLVDNQKVQEYWSDKWEDWGLIQQKVGIEKIREISRLYSFQYGVEHSINLIEEVSDYSDYSKIIENNINNHKICEKDLKEVENFIIKYKLIEVKNLVRKIKNDMHIPIDLASLKLEFFLIEFVKKTNFEKIYTILFNAANTTSSILYKNIKNRHFISKEQERKIYINCVEYLYNKYNDNYDEVFNRRLPQDFFYDDGFKDFIASQLFDSNWNNRGVNELLRGFVEKIENSIVYNTKEY